MCLHGDRKPQERRDNLEAFKQKQVKFLICTDVAARGLDIGGLPFSKFLEIGFSLTCYIYVFYFSDQHHIAG